MQKVEMPPTASPPTDRRPPERHGPVIRRRVEAGALIKFAHATGQTDPRFLGTGTSGEVIAPPTYVGTFCNDALPGVFVPRPGHDMFLHTADCVRQHEPIRAGDTIEARAVLRSVEERVGRYGPTTVQWADMTLVNQHGRTVATVAVEMRSFCADRNNG